MNVETLWFGSEDSLTPYLRYVEFMESSSADSLQMYAGKSNADDDEYDDEDELPQLAQIEGSVGIIDITGSLIPNSNWVTRLFGMTGYDDIADAAVALSDHPDVEDIVLSINSGGGSVMGLESLGNTLKVVAKNTPVYANTEGGMMSAAYWIGSIGRQISSSPMAQLGSIGTVITHTSVHRALKESGRDVTVIRSGKSKALGHPAEKLTAKAKQHLQDQADTMTSFFRQHVEDRRGAKLLGWDSWGEGQTFFSDEAISVGLSDRVVTLNGLVNQLNTIKANHEETTDMGKKVILKDDQAVAQLESGVPLETVEHQHVEETASEEVVETTAEETSQVDASAEDESTEAVAEETPVEASADTTALVAHLKDELASVRTELSNAQAENINAKAELEKVVSAQTALVDIACNAANKMQISLSQSPVDMSNMAVDVVIEQHTATQKQFNDTFHVGQLSADAPVEETESNVSPIDLGIFKK